MRKLFRVNCLEGKSQGVIVLWGNCPGASCPGRIIEGHLSGGNWPGGNFLGAIVQRGIIQGPLSGEVKVRKELS